jgi:hypothetical protein
MNLSRLLLVFGSSILVAFTSGCAADTQSEDSASDDAELRGQRHFTCTAHDSDNGVAEDLTLRVSTLTATVTIPGAKGQRGELDKSYIPRTNTSYYRYLVNAADADSGYILVQKGMLSGHPGTLQVRFDYPETGGALKYDCTP